MPGALQAPLTSKPLLVVLEVWLAAQLARIPGKSELAKATLGCHAAILMRDAVPAIPIRKNGRAWKDD
ncbi:hypothetical protein [Leisingera sp. MMG026]|uniref:hypothetical protein n=1 Tax=Leisingera sp. MMG026 TaxID=2909982 RepID=UPI001F375E6B|nr:hypothetical protein [Leisingera sp. MMG026]MCF6432022.1 hypothetical protein [Leisingera sp. MMG026]